MPEVENTTRSSHGITPKKSQKNSIFVVKIKCLPFGFFEKQLWEYFTQFGKVIRARVARSLKTGNHKGWAYVGFDNKEVAEIAAESMNGYLMFEKRLLCHVMETPPKCMLHGARYLAPPHMKGQAKKNAINMNAEKTKQKEKELKKTRQKKLEKLGEKLKNMGIDYDLSTVPSFTLTKKNTSKPEAATKKVLTDANTPLPMKSKPKAVRKETKSHVKTG